MTQEEREPPTLIEEADKIISQDDHMPEDITELQRIRWRMAQLYSRQCKIAGEQEAAYNASRGKEFVAMKRQKRADGKFYTDNEADRIAKDRSEEKFGKYRITREVAKGMKSSIDTIKDFCLDYYTKRKEERSASTTN